MYIRDAKNTKMMKEQKKKSQHFLACCRSRFDDLEPELGH